MGARGALRRALLRRAGGAVPAGWRRLRLPARGVRTERSPSSTAGSACWSWTRGSPRRSRRVSRATRARARAARLIAGSRIAAIAAIVTFASVHVVGAHGSGRGLLHGLAFLKIALIAGLVVGALRSSTGRSLVALRAVRRASDRRRPRSAGPSPGRSSPRSSRSAGGGKSPSIGGRSARSGTHAAARAAARPRDRHAGLHGRDAGVHVPRSRSIGVSAGQAFVAQVGDALFGPARRRAWSRRSWSSACWAAWPPSMMIAPRACTSRWPRTASFRAAAAALHPRFGTPVARDCDAGGARLRCWSASAPSTRSSPTSCSSRVVFIALTVASVFVPRCRADAGCLRCRAIPGRLPHSSRWRLDLLGCCA